MNRKVILGLIIVLACVVYQFVSPSLPLPIQTGIRRDKILHLGFGVLVVLVLSGVPFSHIVACLTSLAVLKEVFDYYVKTGNVFASYIFGDELLDAVIFVVAGILFWRYSQT